MLKKLFLIFLFSLTNMVAMEPATKKAKLLSTSPLGNSWNHLPLEIRSEIIKCLWNLNKKNSITLAKSIIDNIKQYPHVNRVNKFFYKESSKYFVEKFEELNDDDFDVLNQYIENIDSLPKDFNLLIRMMSKSGKLSKKVEDNLKESLFWHIENRNSKSIVELSKIKEFINIKSILNQNADGSLANFICDGKFEVVESLIHAGADVNAAMKEGWTPLMQAAQDGIDNKLELMDLLIEYGADVNAKDINGLTALIVAAREGFPDAVQLLIEYGADVNAKDNAGLTPLMESCSRDNPETARIGKILIDNGADIYAMDNNGETALDRAVENQKHDTRKLFLINLIKTKMTQDADSLLQLD